MRLMMLIALLALMKLLGDLGLESTEDTGHHAAMAFGFMILAGTVFADWARHLTLPRITGYLLAGVFCGPGVLGMLDAEVVSHLKIFDRTALFLIAFGAGAELRVDSLKQQWKLIVTSSFFQLTLGWAVAFSAFWLVRPYVPFLEGLGGGATVALLALVAMISVAKSPAETVAVIVETGAKGPMRDYVLGVTILMDVLIILAFTLLRQISLPVLGAGDVESHLLHEIVLMITSIAVGAGSGGLLILWMRHRREHLPLVLLAYCLLMVRLCADFHLESLLVAVGAGFVICNFSDKGEKLLHSLEAVSLPIFLVFFGITGAGLDIEALKKLWLLALFYVVVRMFAKWLSNRTATTLLRAPKAVVTHGWKGFLGQAGVSLGFAAIIAEVVPLQGGMVKEMIIAAVLVNQLVGPVLFKKGLEKAGEIGKE